MEMIRLQGRRLGPLALSVYCSCRSANVATASMYHSMALVL